MKYRRFTGKKSVGLSYFSMEFIYEKQRSKNQFHSTFWLFFKTFENLKHDLTLRTLSSVYIHGLKRGCTHPIKS